MAAGRSYFFGFWAVLSVANQRASWFPAILFPPPWEILNRAIQMLGTGELQTHILVSLDRVLKGFLLGGGAGILLGVLVGRIQLVQNFLESILELLRPIPPLAFLPLMVIWFGIGESSKIIFIAYTSFFPVFTTTVEGIKYVDPVLIRAAASLGASERQIFWYVVLPAAAPNIITGMRLAFGLSFFVTGPAG